MPLIQNEDFAKRIAQLERARRRSGLVLTCLAVALLAVATVGARSKEGPSKIVEAKEIVILDSDGRALIRVGPDREDRHNAVMEFFGSDGQRRIVLGVDKVGAPEIKLIEPDGGSMIVMDIQPKGGPAISIRKRERKSGILLGAGPNGVSGLGFMADDGRAHLQLGLEPDGTGQIDAFDAHGDRTFQISRGQK